ncbi:MAG: hypothetical protein LKJ50_00460 [Clostridiales bacterium]|nr:hypothetical protein [Clostridiales bacterium]MCI1960380.1 hypothetical protein [Clostridiales bacterium]MCI2020867.1 hypothetical protein [Clostridiales bacterium]MCI2025250.1 hypothetical protein [Clostridiales bacterium]
MERIYGVRQGSNNPKGTNIGDTPLVGDVSQSDIAQQYNISIDKYCNAEKILNLIPELQDMVQENKVSTSVASRIIIYVKFFGQKKSVLAIGLLLEKGAVAFV